MWLRVSKTTRALKKKTRIWREQFLNYWNGSINKFCHDDGDKKG